MDAGGLQYLGLLVGLDTGIIMTNDNFFEESSVTLDIGCELCYLQVHTELIDAN